MGKGRRRDPMVRAMIIDRPGRGGDHLFIAEHEGNQMLGAVDDSWQRDPRRRARAGLPEDWESDAAAEGGVRLTASLEVPRERVAIEGLEWSNVASRPAFALPDGTRFALGERHGDDDLVERARTWYRAAWKIVSMSKFIAEVADVRAAMLKAGHEKTTDFQEVEMELARARLSITRAKLILTKASRP